MAKTKIVLDADVIIHFAKGGRLSLLPTILSDYEFVVLRPVYEEIRHSIKIQLDNQISLLKNIKILEFTPHPEMLKEYASLVIRCGNGESACMAYCKFNLDVIGSSNIKDITSYCDENGITYLTTYDFLYYAVVRKIMTIDEVYSFVQEVVSKDSKLPTSIDIRTYVSSVIV
jgi:hypothetical protein